MTDRKIMQQALDALKYHTEHTYPFHQTNVAMEALRQALAQPEQPMSPEHLPRYVATNGVKPMEGGGGGGSQPEPDWTTDTPIPPFKYLDLPEYKTTQPEQEPICRADGRCQYAIDHGAEGLGHCPQGKCCMPQPEPEPVAWMLPDYGDVLSANEADGTGIYNIPLYTAPPKRKWVGLTDEEIHTICEANNAYHDVLIYDIEKKLKEKNT